MKLWLISQDKNEEMYGDYDSAVVAAETKEEAKRMHPGNGKDLNEIDDKERLRSNWVVSPNDVKIKYLGEAKDGIKKSVICASFNAG